MASEGHKQNTVDVKSNYSQDELPDLLPVYYKRLFPYGLYYRWLNYGGVTKSYFTNREFSFTLKDDIYIRYQSFGDQQEMEKEIQKRCPYKIDIGAVFTHRPKDHKTVKATAFQAQEKELVFDIDMTDYDDVRNCCEGAAICNKCWPLMTIAIKVMDRALRDDFGFEHLLWVYSGRRGVHCWIADESARKLNQAARSAVAEYLSLVKGGENQTKKVNLPQQLHPSIERAQRIVEEYFKDLALVNQGILGDKENRDKLLSLVPDDMCYVLQLGLPRMWFYTINHSNMSPDPLAYAKTHIKLREILAEELSKQDKKTPEQRWERVKNWVTSELNRGHALKCKHLVTEIMFQYCYPRLDVNVSTGVNHLLKSPFCVHPKTGRVCVPIDPNDADSFDPMTVPDISQLCREIDEYDKAHSTSSNDENQPPTKKRMRDYKKTSMNHSVQVFEKFVTDLEKTWKGKLLEQSDQKMEL